MPDAMTDLRARRVQAAIRAFNGWPAEMDVNPHDDTTKAMASALAAADAAVADAAEGERLEAAIYAEYFRRHRESPRPLMPESDAELREIEACLRAAAPYLGGAMAGEVNGLRRNLATVQIWCDEAEAYLEESQRQLAEAEQSNTFRGAALEAAFAQRDEMCAKWQDAEQRLAAVELRAEQMPVTLAKLVCRGCRDGLAPERFHAADWRHSRANGSTACFAAAIQEAIFVAPLGKGPLARPASSAAEPEVKHG